MTVQDFVKVNGFSNRFWGWGGEDDDIRRRIRRAKLKLTRYDPKVARYGYFFPFWPIQILVNFNQF